MTPGCEATFQLAAAFDAGLVVADMPATPVMLPGGLSMIYPPGHTLAGLLRAKINDSCERATVTR